MPAQLGRASLHNKCCEYSPCSGVEASGLTLSSLALQVKMFAGSGWELAEAGGKAVQVHPPSDSSQRFSIVRVNDFDHAGRTMSVVVLDEQTRQLHVFCKVSTLRFSIALWELGLPPHLIAPSPGCPLT